METESNTPNEPENPRLVNRVTIIGPDLLAKNDAGRLLTSVASVFPGHRLLVTVPGIHAWQVLRAVEVLREMMHSTGNAEIGMLEEAEIYRDAVSLLVRGESVLIRSEPEDMNRMFAADEMLQLLLPKERIQFTGIHLAEVRRKLRLRGESWRISPPPRSTVEMAYHIRASKGSARTGTIYYHSAVTGGRFLTQQEFLNIRPLLRTDRAEALARLKEIVHLAHLVNSYGVRELSFLVRAEEKLSTEALRDLIDVLEKAGPPEDMDRAEKLYDLFAYSLADAAGPALAADDEEFAPWRTAMFCRLFDIDEKTMEEWALGISREFHMNVRWLPGGRIVEKELVLESNVELRVRRLISHYHAVRPGLVSTNIGRVESSLTLRDKSGEEREVYLVTLGMSGEREETRLVRLMKWGILHRLGKGIPLDRAIGETLQYRQYIFDRLSGFTELGLEVPQYTEIQFYEDMPGVGATPLIFFDRPYFAGIVTEKIPPGTYAQHDFIVCLGRLLGKAAAVSLVMGRACPRTGHIFFDDGDEVVQLDDAGLPEQLILVETTGSFNDWTTPVSKSLPHCLCHLAEHLERARRQGIGQPELQKAMEAFGDGLAEEIGRMQQNLRTRASSLRSLFSDRSAEHGGIRCRWEKILDWLASVDTEELRSIVAEDVQLTRYRNRRAETM